MLVHTTANTLWSDLALSGLYVDLLRRMVAVSQGIQGESGGELALPPLQILDGFGRLRAPPPTVLAAEPAVFDEALIGPQHPPGYYGGVGQRRALNLVDLNPPLEPLTKVPASATIASYSKSAESDLKPWLLLAATLLLLLDLVIALGYRGLIKRSLGPRHGGSADRRLGALRRALGPNHTGERRRLRHGCDPANPPGLRIDRRSVGRPGE